MPLDFRGTRCGIQGQICAILAWYWGDEDEWGDETDYKELADVIKAVPKFVAGKRITEHQAWLIFDALGTYPNRSTELGKLYRQARMVWREARKRENP